jgi:antitoxin component of RelBE/YafQ-DinJ toxin-antitoxin module
MARPEKPDDDKSGATIRLRVTSSEKSRIWQIAKDAGLTPSDYIRGLAIGAKPARTVPTTDRELLLKFLAELGKQGSNLNQIARAMNRRYDSAEYSDVDFRQLGITLHEIEELKTLLMGMLTI